MSAPPGPAFFHEELRAIADGLRGDADTHARRVRAEGRIDHLGRRLHGIGFTRGDQIAACLTAALRELAAAYPLAGEKRAQALLRAAGHLDAAREHAAAGVLPPAEGAAG